MRDEVLQFVSEEWDGFESFEFSQKDIETISRSSGFVFWKLRNEMAGFINEIKREFLKCKIRTKRK